LLELASPAPLAPGRLRLLEPDGSSQSALLKQLTDGTYDKPFIEDCGPLRYLHFDLDNVQSVMRHDDPDALCLAYTRKMMTFLLFNAEPRRILLLGLGGGSLAKFCYRHLPGTRIIVLEIDPNVLALREEFQVPPDDERFRVVQGDGVAYIGGRVPSTDGRSLAREDVILVMNVCGEPVEIESHIARIRGVFGERVISLPAKEDGNLIVMGFRTAPKAWDGAELDRRARRLEERFGLAFPRYVRQMVYGMLGAQTI
jgi:spermidine synthase